MAAQSFPFASVPELASFTTMISVFAAGKSCAATLSRQRIRYGSLLYTGMHTETSGFE